MTSSSNGQRVAILLSGGLDSSVAAYLYKGQGYDPTAITFLLRAPRSNLAEVECAKRLASRLGIKHLVFDISVVNELFEAGVAPYGAEEVDPGLLKRTSVALPLGVEIMHVMAVIYALSHDVRKLVWAVQRDDIDSDLGTKCVTGYLRLLNRLIRFRQGSEVEIETPFLGLKTEEIVSLGLSLAVPFEDTFSCLVDSADLSHCGRCEKCLRRAEAFMRACRSTDN